MNTFDKVCAALAFVLAILFLILGVPGAFVGCRANFTLPPILGVLPALIGWGIIRSVRVAWKAPAASATPTAPGRDDL
ncbi:hypothetical protein LLG95_16270 [bacterium]|nr:hypothetical protein [bacterium]